MIEADTVDKNIGSRKVASTSKRVTAIDRDSMKVFDLAQELGVDLPEMKKFMISIGIRGKDGNSRLTGEQVRRIRMRFGK